MENNYYIKTTFESLHTFHVGATPIIIVSSDDRSLKKSALEKKTNG